MARQYTFGAGNDMLGGTVTLEVSTAAAPGTYTTVTPNTTATTIPAGARLRISVAGSTATPTNPGMMTLHRTG